LLPVLVEADHVKLVDDKGVDEENVHENNNRKVDPGNFLVLISKVLQGHRYLA
jgi:hypothetical protein